MSLANTKHPWILGSIAVYAPNLYVARQVYELVVSRKQDQPFGTATLDTGDEVGWIDMSVSCKKHTQKQDAISAIGAIASA